MRVRSSATARSASSRRAAWSARFERPSAARENSVRQIVATVTPTVSPAVQSPDAAVVPTAAARATIAIPASASRSDPSRAAVTPA